jgi:hypothetical protein
LLAFFLDFIFTIIGLILVGPRWEMNQAYRSEWESGNYLMFLGFWLLGGSLYLMVAYLFIRVKRFFRSMEQVIALVLLNAAILYIVLGKLYWGAIGWSITLGCNYYSTVAACSAILSSSPVVQLLNVLFLPILGV